MVSKRVCRVVPVIWKESVNAKLNVIAHVPSAKNQHKQKEEKQQ
jgi:hypothetical protein